jgi:two-component system, cell cycle sensor histidine kinase and response regulator CckA
MSSSPTAKQKQDSLGILAGGIAHDFNNLLMAILGNAEMALDELSPQSPARTFVSEIHAASLRAADLCRQMLVYSGRGNFEFQVFDLNNMAGGLTPLLDPIVPGKIILQNKTSSEPALIKADVTQIQQILVNLVTNSVEAIGEKEGTITVETGVREFSEESLHKNLWTPDLPADRYVFLTVSDTGPGMKNDAHERVFDPFFTTKYAGRGLGLSVVLGIARGHGGTILLDSKQDQGTTVTVVFPLESSLEKPAPSENKRPGSTQTWLPRGYALLADDEPDVRRVAGRMLEKIGFKVLLAEDGLQAVDIFRNNSDIIDIVVLDLTMPRLGGQEACHLIRKIAPGIPVLLSSGFSGEESAFRFPGCEPSGFVQKPYTMVRLQEVLRKVAESP